MIDELKPYLQYKGTSSAWLENMPWLMIEFLDVDVFFLLSTVLILAAFLLPLARWSGIVRIRWLFIVPIEIVLVVLGVLSFRVWAYAISSV